MASSGLFGPHPLTETGVNAAVQGVGPGAYALGEVNNQGTFVISYVGRSDTDLNDRLQNHIGTYRHFKYAFYGSAESAYAKECQLYHDFGGAANDVHPARPQGSVKRCPVCGS